MTADEVSVAQSWLFVPGDHPDKFPKAARSGAHVVILDLEDAVAAAMKSSARQSVAAWISSAMSGDQLVAVRMNPAGTEDADADLRMLRAAHDATHRSPALLVPKAENTPSLSALLAKLPSGSSVIPIIESAAGLLAAYEIARLAAVRRLAFGSIDFALDLDMSETADNLRYARSHLVTVSRAAGLAAPIDGVTRNFTDVRLTTADARDSRQSGFGGKLCIHPRQVQAVNDAFAYTSEESDWAQGILSAVAADPSGSLGVDGEMVDAPVIARAQRIADHVLRYQRRDTMR
ncbi:MAG: CoA ester lyase [Microbacteriaceae bacterium]